MFKLSSSKILWWQTRKWCPPNTLSHFRLKSLGAHTPKRMTLNIRVGKVEVRPQSLIMVPKLGHRSLGNINWPQLKKSWAIRANHSKLWNRWRELKCSKAKRGWPKCCKYSTSGGVLPRWVSHLSNRPLNKVASYSQSIHKTCRPCGDHNLPNILTLRISAEVS